jgi:hypothetical protein
MTVTRTIECYYWNPSLGIDDTLEYTYEDVNGFSLKKPVLTVQVLGKILEELKRTRREYLLSLGIPQVIDTIGRVADLWMDPDYKGRKLALEVLPSVTGFSHEMLEYWGFDYFLSSMRKENLPLFGRLQPQQYREFTKLEDGLVKAYGIPNILHSKFEPEVIGHVCAGNILGIAAFEMIMDKLVDASSWVKVPSEEPVFGALYARSIEEVDPRFASSIAVLPFGSEQTHLQEFLFSHSDLVRATGGESARKTLTELSEKYRVPLAGHWHKFSFIVVAKEYLDKRAREIAELASLDVCAWDQQGCFSPQEIFVETGGEVSPLEFARMLAEEMETTTRALPKGTNSGKIQVKDGYYQYLTKEMMGEPVKIFPSKEHLWLVIYDQSTMNFDPSPLFRVIRVKPVTDIMEIPRIVKPIGRFLQTVGVAIPDHRLIPFADAMGKAGASNMRTVSNMTLQKSWEPWDGRFPLHELMEHDSIHWVSIDTRNMDNELQVALKRKRLIVNERLARNGLTEKK